MLYKVTISNDDDDVVTTGYFHSLLAAQQACVGYAKILGYEYLPKWRGDPELLMVTAGEYQFSITTHEVGALTTRRH